MFDKLIDILKANPRRIVFTEGPDARILEAASRLKKDGFLTPVLVGNVEEVKAAAAKGGFDIEGLEIIDPLTYDKMDEMVDAMVALRKGKMTPEECRELLKKGQLLRHDAREDGRGRLPCSAALPTPPPTPSAPRCSSSRPARARISSPPASFCSAAKSSLAMGDCAINISYEDSVDKEGNVTVSAAQKLAEVAIETARTAKIFGIDPKVAMLSFSTNGSGKGATVALSHEATKVAKEMAPSSPSTARCSSTPPCPPPSASSSSPAPRSRAMPTPSSSLHRGRQHRLQDRAASRRLRRLRPDPAGPERPINDLSRGCNADEVYKMAIITAALA